MTTLPILLALAAAATAPALAASPEGVPDVIYYNGRIATLDPARPDASAVAVKDGRFEAVGGSADMLALVGSGTRAIDLEGRRVVPGLIDAHTHPMETLMMKEGWVDARFPQTPSVRQALANIAEWVRRTPKGNWIFVACVSASENKFAEKRLPTKAELDAVAPDNPLVLANGTHMAVANAMALRMLGVTRGAFALKGGGRALAGPDGEPNGTLTDAMGAAPTTPSGDDLKRYYATGIPALWNANGFTSVLAITPAQALPALGAAARMGGPTIRYTISVWTAPDAEGMPETLGAFAMPEGVDPAYFRVAAIKTWADGENDARTGLMYEPYEGHFDTDPPGERGSLVTSATAMRRFVEIADRNGVAAMIHCSGDKATDLCLDAYEHEAAAGSGHAIMRIEHFGMFQLAPHQLERAAALKKRGLFVSIQPTWLLDLARADVENMGEERARTGFRFRALIDAGLEPAAGTDVTGIYLANVDPFLGIYAAVTRDSDMGPFEPDQAVTVSEALKMWTIWAARAIGEDAVKGSIEPGKYADMTVLSDDIFAMPKERLKEVRAVETIVGGRVVYEAK